MCRRTFVRDDKSQHLPSEHRLHDMSTMCMTACGIVEQADHRRELPEGESLQLDRCRSYGFPEPSSCFNEASSTGRKSVILLYGIELFDFDDAPSESCIDSVIRSFVSLDTCDPDSSEPNSVLTAPLFETRLGFGQTIGHYATSRKNHIFRNG